MVQRENTAYDAHQEPILPPNPDVLHAIERPGLSQYPITLPEHLLATVAFIEFHHPHASNSQVKVAVNERFPQHRRLVSEDVQAIRTWLRVDRRGRSIRRYMITLCHEEAEERKRELEEHLIMAEIM